MIGNVTGLLPGEGMPLHIYRDVSSLPLLENAAERVGKKCLKASFTGGWVKLGMSSLLPCPQAFCKTNATCLWLERMES